MQAVEKGDDNTGSAKDNQSLLIERGIEWRRVHLAKPKRSEDALSQFHRQYHHRHVAQMQPTQHGKRRFTVQLTNVPIVVFEDELAGKEDAVRKFMVDLFGEVSQLFNWVSAEGQVCFGGQTPVMAVADKVIQDFGCLALDPLEILPPPIHRSMDGATFMKTQFRNSPGNSRRTHSSA